MQQWSTFFRQQIKNHGHAGDGVPNFHHLGSITPPLPSPPRMAFDCSITSTTLASPTAERTTLAPENPSAIRSIMRLVDKLATNTPGPMPKHPSGGQGQRALFVNGHVALIHQHQPPASGSWANPTTAQSREPDRAQVTKVGGNGFGRSSKHAMRFAVQVLIRHTQRGKEFSSPFTSSAIHRIKDYRTSNPEPERPRVQFNVLPGQ